MFCTMWPTLGGELSVVAWEVVRKKMDYGKNEQEFWPKQVNFDKIRGL